MPLFVFKQKIIDYRSETIYCNCIYVLRISQGLKKELECCVLQSNQFENKSIKKHFQPWDSLTILYDISYLQMHHTIA